jgi:hypothetical protein
MLHLCGREFGKTVVSAPSNLGSSEEDAPTLHEKLLWSLASKCVKALEDISWSPWRVAGVFLQVPTTVQRYKIIQSIIIFYDILSHLFSVVTRSKNSSSFGIVDLMCPIGNSVVMKCPTIANVSRRLLSSL